MRHECHAAKCRKPVAEKLLFCPRHWRKLSRRMKAEIWRTYVPGQEVTKTPTLEYLVVQQLAVAEVADKEGLFEEAEHARTRSARFAETLKLRAAARANA
jgi:hypothetical protein